jgi:hypothetical protein
VYNFYDVDQNSDEWFELRLGKVTGSNLSKIMANYGNAFGDPARKYAVQLALEQITKQKSVNGFSSEHTERGHAQEPIARMCYENEYFCEIKNGGFFCWGKYGDSPDGLVGSDVVIEIKSVIASVHYDTLKRGAFDPSYKWQLVGHIDCTERDYCHFVSFCADFPEGKQIAVFQLDRDDFKDELKMLHERREQFIDLVQETKNTIIEKIG